MSDTKPKIKNISVNIPFDINERLDKLASQTGRPKTFYIRESLKKYITEMEKIYESHEIEKDKK